MRELLECVPNFSTTDPAVVEEIADAIRSAGAYVLDQSSDIDHNRSVITYAGTSAAVSAAAVRAAGVALHRIDLRRHAGVHPRIGALDVLPFVPLEETSLPVCTALALETAHLIWNAWAIPSYLYGSAALLPERRNLANLRKPGAGPPDVGGPDRHPSAGIIACGARKFLIAFNVNLKSKDTAAARRIASAVRESSGGLPCVQALGLELASRGLTQVSMNLTDFETTPLHVAFLAVESEAARTGIEIEESELIGLIPRKAWELSSHVNMRLLGWNEGLILENRLPG